MENLHPADLSTKNGTENITDTGGKYPKNHDSGQAEAATNSSSTRLSREAENLLHTDPATNIKEEPASCDEGNLTDLDVYKPPEYSLMVYPPADIKEEPVSCEGGNISNCDVYKPTEYPSTDIKEEPDSQEEGNHAECDVYKPTEHSEMEYPLTDHNEETTQFEEGRADTGDKPLTCTECGTGLATKYDLVQHSRILKGEIKCSECGKCFHTKYELGRHERIHTGERPFKCAECGKCINRAAHLAYHKVIHTGKKPFKCTECGKCFTRASHLGTHQWTHSDEKPFKSVEKKPVTMEETAEIATGEPSMRPKYSTAWEYFLLNEAKKIVQCKLCKAELTWHGSTTVMHAHMRRKHMTAEGETPGRKKRRTMTEFVQRRTPQWTPQQSAVATKAVLKMLITDMRPPSMVEDQGFTSMVSVLNPGYTLPSRTHFTKLMETKYLEAFEKVKDAINKTKSRIALTADMWTSAATEAYLGITCHYIEDDWKMTSVCLATMPLGDRPTAMNIAGCLEEVIEKFEIAPEKIVAIVHDNGADIVAAVNLLEEKHGWTSIRCTGHSLQLVITAALTNKDLERAVGAARCLVEHFIKSEVALSKLKENQKQMGTPEHELLQDVSTRWSSTYYMVSRLIEQRRPVTATLSDPSITQKGNHCLDMKPDQWSLLEELSTALKPFECVTAFMSGEEYTTISSVPALMKGLLRYTEGAAFESSSLQSFQVTATQQLQSRWKGIFFEQVPNTVILSSALDPRFRSLKFLKPEQIMNVRAKVRTEALSVRREMVPQQQMTTSTVSTAAEPSTSASLLDSLLASGGSSEEEDMEEKQDINSQVRNEVQAYFMERPLAKEANPLHWWKDNKDKYPTLAELAKSYLCIPGTSTPSERLFSAAGIMVCKKRASLSQEHVDMLTFLHFNAKFLEQ